MILLSLFYKVAATEDQGSLERGVFSLEERNMLLAENFVNAQIVVPHPKFWYSINGKPRQSSRRTTEHLEIADIPVLPKFHKTSENDFQIYWLLKETKKETLSADKDLKKI